MIQGRLLLAKLGKLEEASGKHCVSSNRMDGELWKAYLFVRNVSMEPSLLWWHIWLNLWGMASVLSN